MNDIGENKAHAAKKKLNAQNPFINFVVSDQKLTNQNAIEVFSDFDIILDGTDNFSTRYLVNDACILLEKPLIYGAINKYEGQVSVFNYKGGPTYRCLFPVPPEPGSVRSCSDVGVLGILPGIIGMHQANEALKIILGIGTTLSGRILVYNALESSFTELALEKTTFPPAVNNEKELMEYNYDFFCGAETGIYNSISRADFEALTEETLVLDVRESWEKPKVCNKKVLEIPLEELHDNLNNIPNNEPVYVICQRGSRSASAISLLEKEYSYQNLINVSEGMIG
jgi:adenylyltransferase/sulfurtransferase